MIQRVYRMYEKSKIEYMRNQSIAEDVACDLGYGINTMCENSMIKTVRGESKSSSYA